jgi:hypothetical protein
VEKAIQAELRKRGNRNTDAPRLIVRRSGGRVVVPGVHILWLGGGHHVRGRRFLFAVISAIRGKRGGLGQPKSVRPISGPQDARFFACVPFAGARTAVRIGFAMGAAGSIEIALAGCVSAFAGFAV